MAEHESTETAGVEGSAMRREPQQQRARERVGRMLDAAAALIAEKGSDALRMSEVAERAKVSIGSLYQYFPDKSAIIRTLAARYNEEDRACIEAELADVRDAAELATAFARLVDVYYDLFLAEPVRRDIWSGTQADKVLQAQDLEDDRSNASLLTEVMLAIDPGADRADLATTAFMLWSLAGATVRLAVSLEREEGAALVEAFKRMARRELLRTLRSV